MLFRRTVLLIATLAPIVALSTGARATPFFEAVGNLSGGLVFSTAFAVSGDGSTVVGQSFSTNGAEAYRWTQSGGMVGLGDLAGGLFSSEAFSVSGDGSVVVGRSSSGINNEAFRWTESGGMVGIGALAGTTGSSSFSSAARSVSADGSVAVGESRPPVPPGGLMEAFRYTDSNGVMTGLGDLNGGQSFSGARSVSADGSVVVGAAQSPNGINEAFRWTETDGMIGLGGLGGSTFSSEANAVSDDGAVVVGRSNSANGAEAFGWTEADGMVGLGDLALGQFTSEAFAASADGSVIVGRGNGALGSQAFIWDELHGMRLLVDVLTSEFGLDLTGWLLQEARGISDDGLVIAGNGIGPGSSLSQGWVVSLRQEEIAQQGVPEPATLILFGIGLAGLGVAVRRRRPG